MNRIPGVRYFRATFIGILQQARDVLDHSRTDLTAWADLQDLEEDRTVPSRM